MLIFIGYRIISWSSNLIEKPVTNVLNGTRRIGKGDWGYRIDASKLSIDEFKELTENFNEMATLIEQHILSLAESEETFRLITEHSSDVITIHDNSGIFTYISPAGKELLNYESSDVIGQGVFDFVHQDDMALIKESFSRLESINFSVVTYRVRKKDGEYLWFESSLKRLQIEHTGESRTYVISRNITDRKLTEEKLQEANRLLKSLSI